MRALGIALATAVSLVVFVGVLGTVLADFNVLSGSAGWYGIAVFCAFPLLVAFAAWRWG